MRIWPLLAGPLLAGLLLGAAAPPPVREIGPARIAVGHATAPLFLSQDWAAPLPGVTRAVLVVHGLTRDADVYYVGLVQAAGHAGAGRETLLIAPQILADEDLAGRPEPGLLHWRYDAWAGGLPASGPEPASAFDVFDAVLARLADRRLFPDLREIVVAGHSAGGQVVNRYAIVGHGDAALKAAGVHLRYVVANPSSYVWFGPDRPEAGEAACAGYDQWRYGLEGALPPYVSAAPAALEAAYLAREVVYLLGTRDTDPQHPRLDKSCAAELQGPTRYSRGHNFMAHLRARHPGAAQSVHDVAGVGHNGTGMINSPCGLAALFDTKACD